MKQFKTLILIATVAAVAFIGINSTQAQGYWGQGAPQTAVDSTLNTATNTAFTTNYAYSSSLLSGLGCTNVVWLAQGAVGNNFALQLTGQATAACTNIIYMVLSESIKLPVLANNTTLGTVTNKITRVAFATNSLTLNGTTPVTATWMYTPYSTPAFGDGYNICLECFQNFGTNGAVAFTNYNLVVNQW